MDSTLNTVLHKMIQHHLYTDKGPRHENQDSVEIKSDGTSLVACIADGVSGKDCGKKASSETIRFFLDNYSSGSDLLMLAKNAHDHIRKIQTEEKECNGMATTFTACIVEDHRLKGVHAGDSRLCLLRGNGIKQLSQEHTEVNRLLLSGKITAEDAINYPRRNVLESAIGIRGELQVQTFEFELKSGDRILLTTDGVHNVISKKEFRDLSKKHSDSEQFSNAIIDMLSQKKLSDNVSFILLDVS